MGFRIEHRLGIPASAEQVWAVLGDIEAWPRWTPLYPQVEGKLRIGGTIKVTEQLEGMAPTPSEPFIVDWEPEGQILWRTSAYLGLLKASRFMEIEKLTDTACIFSNGEIFSGAMTRYVPKARRRAIYQAYEAFGEALKARVVAGP